MAIPKYGEIAKIDPKSGSPLLKLAMLATPFALGGAGAAAGGAAGTGASAGVAAGASSSLLSSIGSMAGKVGLSALASTKTPAGRALSMYNNANKAGDMFSGGDNKDSDAISRHPDMIIQQGLDHLDNLDITNKHIFADPLITAQVFGRNHYLKQG